MVLLRLAGYLLALLSFALVVVDGARSIAAGELAMMPLSGIGTAFGSSGAAILAALQDGAGSAGLVSWEPMVAALLALPTSLIALILALGMLLCDAAMHSSMARMRQSLRRGGA